MSKRFAEFGDTIELKMATGKWTFFVSDHIVMEMKELMEPLTVTRFVRSVARNFLRMSLYRVVMIVKRAGFLEPKEGDCLDFRKDWRWRFWEVRKRRKIWLDGLRAEWDGFNRGPRELSIRIAGREYTEREAACHIRKRFGPDYE